MKHLIMLFGIVFLFTACIDNTVYFDKPQPEGLNNLSVLPPFYIGEYLDKDSNLMTINRNNVILKSYYTMSYTKAEIDRSKKFYIYKKYLIDRKTNEKFPFEMAHDTIIALESKIDTIFNLSNENIARVFKGNLILNYKKNKSWRVEVLSLNSWVLKHSNFTSKDLFNKLTTISNSEVVTNSTKKVTVRKFLKPTKKQFENILSQKDSLLINTYNRIK